MQAPPQHRRRLSSAVPSCGAPPATRMQLCPVAARHYSMAVLEHNAPARVTCKTKMAAANSIATAVVPVRGCHGGRALRASPATGLRAAEVAHHRRLPCRHLRRRPVRRRQPPHVWAAGTRRPGSAKSTRCRGAAHVPSPPTVLASLSPMEAAGSGATPQCGRGATAVFPGYGPRSATW